MSDFSGYDSEAVGFNSVAEAKRSATQNGTQTNFSASGVGCQTTHTHDVGCTASETVSTAKETPGLNEFLRKVVPAMMEQLDQTDADFSSDSDDEEVLNAKLFQELKLYDGAGFGDHQSAVLGVTWSSAGNSLAVSLGNLQHETWCLNTGLIKVYTMKRAASDKFVHSLDITEKNCVTAVKYHPTIAALLAYGTTSGEVVLCNLMNGNLDEGTQLASPSGCHGSRRVSSLQWADAPLANVYLIMQIHKRGKRRSTTDQVLLSSGSDGTLNVWLVNANQKIFENITCYKINTHELDITCFDFAKSQPQCSKVPDIFVVGTKRGRLYLCKIDESIDPVYNVFEGDGTCVLDVAFSGKQLNIFYAITMSSELRVYDVMQGAPVKVLCMDWQISCMGWLPTLPCVVLGVADEGTIKVYNVSTGKPLPVEGITGNSCVTCVAVSHTGSCRIASGDSEGCLRIWELPSHRIKINGDLEF